MASNIVTNAMGLLLWTLALIVVYTTSRVIYNIFLHPLRSYPGPISARASVIPYQRQRLKGSDQLWLHNLHKVYGPVVRFTPRNLSYIEPEVWRDVYSHRATSFQKELRYFYGPDAYGSVAGLVRADNVSHARQRKLVAHAFSDRALKDQEQLLKNYASILVDQMKRVAMGGPKHVVDLVQWYNFTTFDIMADLVFGEDLGQLSGSMYNAWVFAIFTFVKSIAIAGIIREWGLTKVLNLIMPAEMKAKRDTHVSFAAEKVDKRMAQKTTRPDIWTYVTKNSDKIGEALAPSELHSNGATFMLAGTETTATSLAGVTYMLLRSPEKLRRVTKEVRNAFSTFEDLTMTKLAQLEYLQACLEEGLRMYPPVATGLPRITPEGGAMVCGRWVPGGAIVQGSMYSAAHSATNFKNPDIFAPERYLPEGAQEYAMDRKDSFNPFSIGPRNCLGKNLAYHEMRLILASMLLHFDIELSPETGDWLNQKCYFLWDKKPLLVKLKIADRD